MTVNQEIILKHMNEYKKDYYEKFHEYPHSWFNYLNWLSSFTFAYSFNADDIKLTKRLLKKKIGGF